ncbi:MULTISPECIES: threonine ammonia-lyase [unclassified Campylobacter]|uniref:threonine ammonia-lyase n=1 Tax=unclassified Campylobacter TaxID=2593542 RepID=UPI001796266A|nr:MULTISPECIES: threonine ammonia-lyase [unclassified Campylobacter]EAH6868148.1 threonine ammonia-lyase [Campylobacter lari]MCV3376375.1 threonine ammonia-lyase [Campylobacter sp. IFREMER_LSEM_CL2194]MCV3396782.1 threonine ammonia-lyase [Campylobacter sp. RKI_CA19_01116]HEC1751473.1 threonine ammonia-lyase [Campylobacter lari]HEC1767014.1 threonine ammonia-lyase [Campylobacter lari]
MVELNKIYQAKQKIADFVLKTPFVHSSFLSEFLEADVFLKCENLQKTGAYKIRGAYNTIANLTKEQKQAGVIAASAGNHAQGVAISAKKFGIEAVIVMPEATPLLKVSATKNLGAKVILKGDNFDEAYAYALNYAKEHHLNFIHPFENESIIAGQGTLMLEMLDEISDLDMILAPVGGGGLISGVASAAKQINPAIKVIGVSAKGAPAMYESFKSKKMINSKAVRTIADGIAVRDVNKINFDIILECVDDFIQVDDEEIANAVLYLLEKHKITVEGAGASAVAALLHKKIDLKNHKKIGVVLSGGNIDVQMLNIIIEKGLFKAFRKMLINVTLVDKPGALSALSDAIKEAQANIVKIDYDRFSTKLEYGDAMISITLETKGKEHQELVRKILYDKGFNFNEIL